ncbi:hypothetical protein Maes01_00989 [Microbulbifer aestuariivivens]|uniref:Peptidase C39-like domain-containing protein n=1 Tax=Microbulbifer aestuariivivens TaxID=1908308 RepID=A0ABP9WML3_9GAMM
MDKKTGMKPTSVILLISALASTAAMPLLMPVPAHATQATTVAQAGAAPDLPYWQQTENRFEPERTCSLTSLAMVTDSLGLTSPDVNGRTPDYLFTKLGGVRQTVPALQSAFNSIAEAAGSQYRAHSKTDGTIAEVRQALNQGHPVIIHGWFTPSGHILVVTGFDGSHYTVHDPNGRWNLKKWGAYDTSVSGQGLRYPREAFERAINDNGSGDDLWLHIFRRAL